MLKIKKKKKKKNDINNGSLLSLGCLDVISPFFQKCNVRSNLVPLGEGKLRAAGLRVCESASLRVVPLYSASHVHDMAQRP